MKTQTTSICEFQTDTLEFRDVKEKDIPLLQGYFNLYPQRSCDFSVGGVMMWIDYFDYKIAEAEDSLFITGRIPGTDTNVFYIPSGPIRPERYIELISNYCEAQQIKGFLLIPEESTPADEKFFVGTMDEYADNWKEYLYDIDRFTRFSGRKMEKKRNHLNFFLNNYSPVQIKEISSEDAADLITFTLAFGMNHADSELADYEINQVIKVLRNYDSYSFYGIIIKVDDKIAGYTFGEKSGDVFFVHVEKGDISVRGIYQALASRLAIAVRERFPEVMYLNREEDMGEENLRISKESYHPSRYVKKRIIKLLS